MHPGAALSQTVGHGQSNQTNPSGGDRARQLAGTLPNCPGKAVSDQRQGTRQLSAVHEPSLSPGVRKGEKETGKNVPGTVGEGCLDLISESHAMSVLKSLAWLSSLYTAPLALCSQETTPPPWFASAGS